jgi:hypothetical protein
LTGALGSYIVGSFGGTPLEQPIIAVRNNAKFRRKNTVMVFFGKNSMVG